MEQSLLRDHWLHVLFMCFAELVLAELGKTVPIYTIHSMGLLFVRQWLKLPGLS